MNDNLHLKSVNNTFQVQVVVRQALNKKDEKILIIQEQVIIKLFTNLNYVSIYWENCEQ